MNDRVVNGFIAGVAGGILMSAGNLISRYLLGIAEMLYLEWASVLIFGYRPATALEAVIAQIGQLFFAGIMGVVFALLLPRVSSRYYLFKGWLYGLTVWFATYATHVLYKVTPLMPIKPDTAMSNMVTASLYGLALAGVLGWLTRKVF